MTQAAIDFKGLIQEDRAKNGKPPLLLSSNTIAQEHADKMLSTKILQHNLQLPFGSRENIGVIKGYYAHYNITEALSRLEYLMMYEDQEHNWEHRTNILNWNSKTVSIGIAYNDEYIYLVQDFFIYN